MSCSHAEKRTHSSYVRNWRALTIYHDESEKKKRTNLACSRHCSNLEASALIWKHISPTVDRSHWPRKAAVGASSMCKAGHTQNNVHLYTKMKLKTRTAEYFKNRNESRQPRWHLLFLFASRGDKLRPPLNSPFFLATRKFLPFSTSWKHSLLFALMRICFVHSARVVNMKRTWIYRKFDCKWNCTNCQPCNLHVFGEHALLVLRAEIASVPAEERTENELISSLDFRQKKSRKCSMLKV